MNGADGRVLACSASATELGRDPVSATISTGIAPRAATSKLSRACRAASEEPSNGSGMSVAAVRSEVVLIEELTAGSSALSVTHLPGGRVLPKGTSVKLLGSALR
jgi:hypothetical protein